MVITIAHAGHWALGLLEVTPVAIALAVVGWKVWIDRRAPAATEAEVAPHA